MELILIRHGESAGNVARRAARRAGAQVIEVPGRDPDADLQQILAAEVADRHDTAEQFEAHGRAEEAAQVRAEAEVIDRYRR